jgi:hypothetical protein
VKLVSIQDTVCPQQGLSWPLKLAEQTKIGTYKWTEQVHRYTYTGRCIYKSNAQQAITIPTLILVVA